MKQTLFIKNMVCDRCKSTVKRELSNLGYTIELLELGKVVINTSTATIDLKLKKALENNGFEIIKDETEALIEELKIAVIQKIENQDATNLSSFLSTRFNKSYSALSKLFSTTEGMTIEKYEIELKIEKVKELIQLGTLNFSEIAYSLNYNSSSHLARQFKKRTGLSMTAFKNSQKWNRKSIDRII